MPWEKFENGVLGPWQGKITADDGEARLGCKNDKPCGKSQYAGWIGRGGGLLALLYDEDHSRSERRHVAVVAFESGDGGLVGVRNRV